MYRVVFQFARFFPSAVFFNFFEYTMCPGANTPCTSAFNLINQDAGATIDMYDIRVWYVHYPSSMNYRFILSLFILTLLCLTSCVGSLSLYHPPSTPRNNPPAEMPLSQYLGQPAVMQALFANHAWGSTADAAADALNGDIMKPILDKMPTLLENYQA
jgi:hypothetical protein